MVCPPLAGWLLGFDDTPWQYRFAMGYGAALMFGWTGLLLWARQSPLERRFVAALTSVVLCGLVATEVFAVLTGGLAVWRILPIWGLQAYLLALFATAYRRSAVPAKQPWPVGGRIPQTTRPGSVCTPALALQASAANRRPGAAQPRSARAGQARAVTRVGRAWWCDLDAAPTRA